MIIVTVTILPCGQEPKTAALPLVWKAPALPLQRKNWRMVPFLKILTQHSYPKVFKLSLSKDPNDNWFTLIWWAWCFELVPGGKNTPVVKFPKLLQSRTREQPTKTINRNRKYSKKITLFLKWDLVLTARPSNRYTHSHGWNNRVLVPSSVPQWNVNTLLWPAKALRLDLLWQ